ncbi:hypothetical protein [Tautonia marina]|uniref:hypothetical protein n=1 Tax=Tautonia marina TaxID=2653855 RepID=UPI001F2EC779|nr:hypothetical protein [Tautonia marina]
MNERSPEMAASLCRSCVSKRDVVTGKGSRFLLCERSRTDPSFPKYPMQPVLSCPGFEPRIDPPVRD